MNAPRPLRDVLGEQADRLAEDHQAVLAEAGHPDLADALVAEAVVSYAETAPHQVAEHLAPFVTAHSAVRHQESPGSEADLSHGLHLLATAPAAGQVDAELAADALDADRLDVGLDADLDAALDTGGESSEAIGTAVEGPGGADSEAPDFGSGAHDELRTLVPPTGAGIAEPAGEGTPDMPIVNESDDARFPGDAGTSFADATIDFPIADGAGNADGAGADGGAGDADGAGADGGNDEIDGF